MLTVIYLANVLVAGWISICSLFFLRTAQTTVFSGKIAYSESIRLVGALWFAVFVLSVVGLWQPEKMQLILLFQLIYKSAWLVFVAVPAIINRKSYPKEMAVFFLIWVLVLPFFIHWKQFL